MPIHNMYCQLTQNLRDYQVIELILNNHFMNGKCIGIFEDIFIRKDSH
jgi:hypothetical protein